MGVASLEKVNFMVKRGKHYLLLYTCKYISFGVSLKKCPQVNTVHDDVHLFL